MTVTFDDFIMQIINYPTFLIVVVLMLGVMFANGCNDSPNAIATCISTRCLSPKKSMILFIIFDFFGIISIGLIGGAVAKTMYNMISFDGNIQNALSALCAGLFAVVVWQIWTSYLGIPTSGSHSLIAGITGAAIALQKSLDAININEWIKVIYGLIISVVIGFILGLFITKLIKFLFKNLDRKNAQKIFGRGQIIASCGMAFMHGAQDGQKFIGIFMLGIFLANGNYGANDFIVPIWLMILCSFVIALGTVIGGYKVIKTVGMNMVKLEKFEGFAADLAGGISLFLSSIWGLPVSTTHTKTTAIMGVGCAKRISNVNWNVAGDMVWAWILTFPGCGIFGYISACLFMKIF